MLFIQSLIYCLILVQLFINTLTARVTTPYFSKYRHRHMQYYCELSMLLHLLYSFAGSTPITVVRIVDCLTFATSRQDSVFDRPLHCLAITILAVSHPHIHSLLLTTGWLLVHHMHCYKCK